MKTTKTMKLERVAIYASTHASAGKIITKIVELDETNGTAIINPGKKNQRVMSYSPRQQVIETATLKYNIVG